jgi:hypothetical protein
MTITAKQFATCLRQAGVRFDDVPVEEAVPAGTTSFVDGSNVLRTIATGQTSFKKNRVDDTSKQPKKRVRLSAEERRAKLTAQAEEEMRIVMPWLTLYQLIDKQLAPYYKRASVRAARGEDPTGDDDEALVVLCMDSRPDYVEYRDHIKEKREELREFKRYKSIEHAMTLCSINVEAFINTPGGHLTLIDLYMKYTDYKLVVFRERSMPVVLVNGNNMPRFILEAPGLKVGPVIRSQEYSARRESVQCDVEYPRKGKVANGYGWISELDMFLVYLADLCRQTNPHTNTCVVGRDGDYVLVMLLALQKYVTPCSTAIKFGFHHVWPSGANTVSRFDIERLAKLIPASIAPSMVMAVYLSGCDFSDKLPFLAPDVIVSMCMGTLLGQDACSSDLQEDKEHAQRIRHIVYSLNFIDPNTWAFDSDRFLRFVDAILSCDYISYINETTEIDAVTGHMKLSVSRGRVSKNINRSTEQKDTVTLPDFISDFEKATINAIEGAYRAALHYGMHAIDDHDTDGLFSRGQIDLLISKFKFK